MCFMGALRGYALCADGGLISVFTSITDVFPATISGAPPSLV
jgi:hypothetical protein